LSKFESSHCVTVLWDVTSCSWIDMCRCFRRTCYQHLQVRRLLFHLKDGGNRVLQNGGIGLINCRASCPSRQ